MSKIGGVPKNLIPAKVGDVRNPNGRPRKTISSVNIELEKQGLPEATKQDITSCYLRLIQLTTDELRNIAKEQKDQPALVRIVSSAILSKKGFDIIEKILDRGLGKAISTIDVTVSDERRPIVFEYLPDNENEINPDV